MIVFIARVANMVNEHDYYLAPCVGFSRLNFVNCNVIFTKSIPSSVHSHT